MELRELRQNPAVLIALSIVMAVAVCGYFYTGYTYNGFWGVFWVIIELVVMLIVSSFACWLIVALIIGVPFGICYAGLMMICRFCFGKSFAQELKNLLQKGDKWFELGVLGLASIFWLVSGISAAYRATEYHHLGQDGRQCIDNTNFIYFEKAEPEVVTAALNACTRYLDSGKGSDYMRGEMYMWRGGYAKTKNDFDLALADSKQASRLRPEMTLPWSYSIDIFKAKGDCEGLIDAYTQKIRIEPNEWSNFIGRGRAYVCKHDYDKAIANFDEAIRLSPDNASGYLDRANARKAKGQTDLAQADFSAAVRVGSKDLCYSPTKLFGFTLFCAARWPQRTE